MRRIALLIAIVLVLTSAVPTLFAQDGGETALFSTSDGTFQFTYPATWASSNASSGEVILAPSEAILAKNLTDFTSGDMSYQVLSPLFTAQFSSSDATTPLAVLATVQARLGTSFTPISEISETTYGPYTAARLDLTAEGLDVVIVAVGVADDAVSLIFGFAPGGERDNLLAPIAQMAASMVYSESALDLGAYTALTTANADELDNVIIWGGHASGVRNVAFNAEGTQIASADNTSVVIVRDVASGDEVFRLVSERIISAGPAFSPDGRFLLFGSPDGTVWQWNLVEDRLEGEWGPMGGTVWDVAYGPDGTTIAAASNDLSVRVWLASENTPIAVLIGHRNDVVSVAYDTSGDQLVTASLDGTVRLWDIKSAASLMTLVGPVQGLTSAAISPDGKLIAGGGVTGTLHVWDVATQLERYNFAADAESTEAVTGVAFNRDGTLLAASREDGSVRLWQAETGIPITTLGGSALMNDLAFSPDGRLLAAADESGVVLVWGVAAN